MCVQRILIINHTRYYTYFKNKWCQGWGKNKSFMLKAVQNNRDLSRLLRAWGKERIFTFAIYLKKSLIVSKSKDFTSAQEFWILFLNFRDSSFQLILWISINQIFCYILATDKRKDKHFSRKPKLQKAQVQSLHFCCYS